MSVIHTYGDNRHCLVVSLDLRPVGDIVLKPSLRKSEHYLWHRTHMQFVLFDVPKRTK